LGIKILVAVDTNFAIGYKNKLLFHISDDLKRFKKLTTGNYVLMGRKTFESILSYNNKPLPNRLNVVLTRNRKYEVPLGVFKSESVGNIINHYKNGIQDKDLFCIGGNEVYNSFLPYADEVLITYIDAESKLADTYFNRQTLEKDFYISKSEKNHCEKTGLDFYFVTYKRTLK
jgi:dihydrofolate reductase